MKHIININLSKDTPVETLTALYAALKTEKKQKNKQSELYLSNDDIENLNARYEELFKQVKRSENLSEKQIEKECETLSQKYDFEINELCKLRKVEYDINQAEIKAREAEQSPWRRGWWWRLIFRPLTNRAQDIIEERAKLEADSIHTVAEKLNENARNMLKQDDGKKLSKCKLKRKTQDKLKTVIKEADKSDLNEAFTEPQSVPTEQAKTNAADVMHNVTPAQEPPKEQLSLNVLPTATARRPRPPRSCR